MTEKREEIKNDVMTEIVTLLNKGNFKYELVHTGYDTCVMGSEEGKVKAKFELLVDIGWEDE